MVTAQKREEEIQDVPLSITAFSADMLEARGWRVDAVEESFRAAARIGRLPLWMRPFTWLPSPKRWNPKRVWSGLLTLARA